MSTEILNVIELQPFPKQRPGKHGKGHRASYSLPTNNRRRVAASGPGSLNCFAEALSLHRSGHPLEAAALLDADFEITKFRKHAALAAIWRRQHQEQLDYNAALAARKVEFF